MEYISCKTIIIVLNQIGEKGGASIAEALKTNEGLSILNIGN